MSQAFCSVTQRQQHEELLGSEMRRYQNEAECYLDCGIGLACSSYTRVQSCEDDIVIRLFSWDIGSNIPIRNSFIASWLNMEMLPWQYKPSRQTAGFRIGLIGQEFHSCLSGGGCQYHECLQSQTQPHIISMLVLDWLEIQAIRFWTFCSCTLGLRTHVRINMHDQSGDVVLADSLPSIKHRRYRIVEPRD